MNNQEYIQNLVAKYNANPNDETLSATEKTLLAKIAGVERKVAELFKQAEELEKEINAKTQSLMEVRNVVVRERGKSEAFLEALLALK